jgi:hypothetical protein
MDYASSNGGSASHAATPPWVFLSLTIPCPPPLQLRPHWPFCQAVPSKTSRSRQCASSKSPNGSAASAIVRYFFTAILLYDSDLSHLPHGATIMPVPFGDIQEGGLDTTGRSFYAFTEQTVASLVPGAADEVSRLCMLPATAFPSLFVRSPGSSARDERLRDTACWNGSSPQGL